jgi:thioredoxin reductase (NADPH)
MAGPVTGLEPAAGGFTLRLAGGRASRARSVLITTGVSYRRLEAPGLDALLGAGVFYGATASEAAAFAGEHVFIAGGANSAGLAAVSLVRYAAQVTIVVRGGSLAARMSQYLIDEITATPNIDVRTTTQIAAAEGTGKLETLILADPTTGSTQTVPASALVILIGAVPHTDWLPPGIRRDEHGFILTGSDLLQGGNPRSRVDPAPPAASARDQPARHIHRRRCPPRLGQTRRLRGRRGLYCGQSDVSVLAETSAQFLVRDGGHRHSRPNPGPPSG